MKEGGCRDDAVIVPQAMLAKGDEENWLDFRVNGLAGDLCKVRVSRSWTVREAKAAVEEAIPHVPAERQRLVVGNAELRNGDVLSSVLEPGVIVDVTLIQRAQEQADWIQEAESNFTNLFDSPDAWSDRDTVLTAVCACGLALQHASADLRADRDVVMAAVVQNGLALQFAAPELTSDTALVLEAVAHCGRAMEFAAVALRSNEDFVFSAVQRNWRALEYCDDRYRANRDLVLIAVAQSGQALNGAAVELREDYEVVVTAIEQDPRALAFAAPNLRTDKNLRALARERRRSRESFESSLELREFRERQVSGSTSEEVPRGSKG